MYLLLSLWKQKTGSSPADLMDKGADYELQAPGVKSCALKCHLSIYPLTAAAVNGMLKV